jgi:hypothetical protein
VIEPLHVGTVGGKPLRFFRTPLNDGRPDMPWAAIDDVGRCIGLSRTDRRIHLRAAVRAFEGIARSVATPDGPTTIVPHTLILAAIEGLIDIGRVSASARDNYAHACAVACMKLGVGPFPSPEAANAWAHAAANRWSPGQNIDVPDLSPFLINVSAGQTAKERPADETGEILISEQAMLSLPMRFDGDKGNEAKAEMIEIVKAWYRGELLPQQKAPLITKLYGTAFKGSKP